MNHHAHVCVQTFAGTSCWIIQLVSVPVPLQVGCAAAAAAAFSAAVVAVQQEQQKQWNVLCMHSSLNLQALTLETSHNTAAAGKVTFLRSAVWLMSVQVVGMCFKRYPNDAAAAAAAMAAAAPGSRAWLAVGVQLGEQQLLQQLKKAAVLIMVEATQEVRWVQQKSYQTNKPTSRQLR